MSLSDPAPIAETCEGFVLAGGQSSRMGQDKARINFNGMPLIQQSVGILRSAGLTARIAGARSDLSSYAPTLTDDPVCPGLGPLSGICPALMASVARYAVFLPVDLPLLPAALVGYLAHHAQATESAITMASLCGFVETFPVVIDRNASPTFNSLLRSENRKCLSAFRAAADALSKPMTIVPVELLLRVGKVHDPHGLPPHAWFLSLNTPEDLTRAEDLLAKRGHQIS